MLLNRRANSDHIRVCLLSVVYAAALFSYTAATQFEFDACDMPDNSHGICRVFQECLSVVDELKRGRISIDDPTRCGFKGNDELICCPTEEAVVTRTTTPWIFDNSREVKEAKSGRSADVWEPRDETEKEATTTAKPDFWLHLLSSTTTTPKPLVVGDQQLDNNSQFYDFSKLLQPGLNGGSSVTNTDPPSGSLRNQTQTPVINREVGGNVFGHGLENRPLNGFESDLGINGVQNGIVNEYQLQGNEGGGGSGNGRGPRDKLSFGNGFENGVENNLGNDHSGNGFGFSREQGQGRGRGRGRGRGNGAGNGFANGPGRGNGNGFGNGPGRGNGNGFVNGPGRGNGNGFVNGPGRGNGAGFGNGRSRNSFGNVFGDAAANTGNQFPDSTWQSSQIVPVLTTIPVENPNQVWPNQAQVQVPSLQPQQPIIFVENANPMIFSNADPNVVLLDPNWSNQNNEAIQHNVLNPTPVLTWPSALVANPAPAESVHTIFNQPVTHSDIKAESLVFPNVLVSQTPQTPFRPQTDVTDNSIDNVGKAAEDHWVWSTSNNASPTGPSRITSNTNSRTTPTTTSTTTPTTTTRRTSINPAVRTERPAVAACRAIEQNLSPFLTPHILDGTPVAPGEYPHMAAIGYSAIGEEGGPYDFRCGGTLIHERFVLTAAHCVNSRNVTPAIVRLGMADFDDPDEIPNRQEIPIKTVHIHDNYSSRRKYDDIALLELQREAKFSTYVYPTCLYTDLADPPKNSRLYVTGWGTVNTTTRMRSDILLKAQLQIEPLDNCNSSYVEFGLTRQLDRGVLKTQLCARDPGYTKDACQGDSGGPLNMVIDESTKSFRVVGVISTGFGCASSIPGLFTRVSAYLDFIENIVWPTN